uniref:ABC transporter domain-containing protein n=4 Tax=Ditylum brightwellii TaxID=49249 RepID=A0A6V2H2N6_9STRA
MRSIESLRTAVQETSETVKNDASASSSLHYIDNQSSDRLVLSEREASSRRNTDIANGDLMTIEAREHGQVTFKTWLLWFQYAGGVLFLIIQTVAVSADRFAFVLIDWWLAQWTKAHDGPITVLGKEFPSQEVGRSGQYQYLAVWAIVYLFAIVLMAVRTLWAVYGGARCSRKLFSLMLSGVLKAPMFYFETTPLGRILNRFTYDVEILDFTLIENMVEAMMSLAWFITSVSVMCSILPMIGAVIVPVTVMYFVLSNHYLNSGTDLQRLDVVSRSPIQAMLAEGVDGATMIRVFCQEQHFIFKFQTALDKNTAAQLNFIAAQRWLGLRVQLLGVLIVFSTSLFVVLFNDYLKLDPGLIGLLILWAFYFTITLDFWITAIANTEAALTSLERAVAVTKLPEEKPFLTEEGNEPSPTWPQKGQLDFEHVCMRYREGLPLVLTDLSFTISPGQRCGVVGRTGAGKTSLVTALFRLVEIDTGAIKLDGVDLSALGLSDVRGRPNSLSIIPQDPVLFSGSLRECLDPFGLSKDEDVLDALVSVRLAGDGDGYDVLDRVVEDGGMNYSVGERQLLCLAQALLNKPIVLVMDEATASVDGETDAFIQRMLRTRFKNITLLTIAHRLHTIMDYDVILVMDAGKAVEFGPPSELLEQSGSLFAELVNSTGEESSKFLREMSLHHRIQ